MSWIKALPLNSYANVLPEIVLTAKHELYDPLPRFLPHFPYFLRSVVELPVAGSNENVEMAGLAADISAFLFELRLLASELSTFLTSLIDSPANSLIGSLALLDGFRFLNMNSCRFP